MGRTIPTMRQSMEILSARIQKMSQIMRSEDIDLISSMMLKGRKHAHEISYSGLDTEFGFILSILLEMEKELKRIRESMDG
ncbi:MAG: hypothetical protein M1476_04140 [Candidatus Thermoplasmatota archaeon]|nr:hypothetical protein [Candidatus Thermoplasmatota archaeon]